MWGGGGGEQGKQTNKQTEKYSRWECIKNLKNERKKMVLQKLHKYKIFK